MKSPLLFVPLLALLAIGPSACNRHGEACLPSSAPPTIPVATATVTGTITYTLAGTTESQSVTSAADAGAQAAASMDSRPDIQLLDVGFGYVNLTVPLADLRQAAVGTQLVDTRVEVFDGPTREYSTYTQATVTITRATGSATTASPYVTPDFERTGTIVIALDGSTAKWDSIQYPGTKPRGFTMQLALDFTQNVTSYGDEPDPAPCTFDISK